jgi:release factor glutamine methyltransferase
VKDPETGEDLPDLIHLRPFVREAAEALERAGVPSPWVDAAILAAYVMEIEVTDLVKHDLFTIEQCIEMAGLLERREAREPLQHLTGRAPFRRLEFLVGPGVFIPRPETEVVVEAALGEVSRLQASGVREPVVVDLGTGSGAIAASIAIEAPGTRVHAVELDPEAHVWAQRNLRDLGIDLRLGDASESFPDLEGAVDIVVTNPPYIPPDGQIRDPEVLLYDPPLALWGGGADGLDVARVVTARAGVLLHPGGLLVMEHADVQRGAVLALFDALGSDWSEVADHRDLAGRDRYVTARRGRMHA